MSTTSNQPDPHNDHLIAIAQRSGNAWRCLFATTDAIGQPSVVETIEVANDSELASLMDTKQPTELFAILPGSATVCRTTTLPDVEEVQIAEALRLQAESKLLGGTPEHRRAKTALDSAVGETNRVGLIIAWPESSSFDVPACLENANFIPDAASIAALLDGLRPTEPIIYADPADGTVTIALSHANGAALRATREDATDSNTFSAGIASVARETATAHNHTPAFTEALVSRLQSELSSHSFDTPLLILPEVIADSGKKRVLGIEAADSAWWSAWGILVGGILTATGTISALTDLQLHAQELNPSTTEKLLGKGSESRTALKLAIAAVLLIAVGPAFVSGIKLTTLNMMNPNVQMRYAEVVEARKQQIVYKELSKKAWPMTKITADVINNVPLGIDIDMIKINFGDQISISGRALGKNGLTAPELIAKMQENLQNTGIFTDIQFSYKSAGTYGDREFDLGASVADPLKRPRYTKEQDFGLWSVAMRDAGIQPDEETALVEDTTVVSEFEDDSPMAGANSEMQGNEGETPIFLGDDGNTSVIDRPVRPRSGGGSDAGSRANERNSGGEGTSARIPEPLSAEQIAMMDETEARVALSEVAVGKKHVQRDDDATKERLKNEMRMLLDRLKELG